MYVSLFAYNSGTGVVIVSKFSGYTRDGFTCKNLGRESWLEVRKLAFFVSCRTSWPCTTADNMGTVMGTGQAISAHTGAGRQCTDAIETGVVADGPTCILHTGMGSGGLGRVKS